MLDTLLDQTIESVDNQTMHAPVMCNEVLEYLNLKKGDNIVDCTIGLAGHAQAIIEKIGSEGRLVGIDRDGESLEIAKEKLSPLSQRCNFIQKDFRHLEQVLAQLGILKVDAILFDLGVSSFQLDNPQRGFSFKTDGPLDMRMDRNNFISAYDLINFLSEREISTILKDFGQERWHNRIAHYLVMHREKNPLNSTKELSQTILKAIPYQHKKQKIHPATRTFQAFRIVVNRELEALEIALDKGVDYLRSGGRICVVSFHSLEDRIVKQKFRYFEKIGTLKLIFKKPLRPQEEEIHQNPRSRSACMRVAEKI